jgi:peptidoglycan/xylan/chitin deacetylase (PgdA/CDA1 family)
VVAVAEPQIVRPSRRARLAAALGQAGVAGAMLTARRRLGSRGVSALVYHRVAPLPEPGGLDRDLIDATPAEFEAQMKLLRRFFTPVGIDEVVAARLGRGALPPDALLVTFDDGYKDNHQHALPILRRLGMKAVFFVSTDFITRRRLFWWERVSLIVRRCVRRELRIAYPRPLRLVPDEPGTVRTLNRIIKDEVDLDLERFLDGLAAAAGVGWSASEERALADAALMTWEDVRALRDAGMDVASHAAGHRVLATLSGGALDQDLVGSRRTLEEVLGEPVRALAYPVGRSIAADRRLRGAVARAGYTVGFTALPGRNHELSGADPFDLRRVRVSLGTTPGRLAATLAFPALAE